MASDRDSIDEQLVSSNFKLSMLSSGLKSILWICGKPVVHLSTKGYVNWSEKNKKNKEYNYVTN